MTARAVIFGCSGPELTAEERAFFSDADPWGFILFTRNITTPAGVRRLVASLRDAVGRAAPILIDQEGGRVARLQAPTWPEWPAALAYAQAAGDAHLREAMYLRGRLIAADLQALGIDVNCAPLLDVACAETHSIILNRTYGHDPATVALAARAIAEGQLAGGVLSVAKHIPGHGRATLDSHHDLPRLDTPLEELRAVDFEAFRRVSDLPMAMTAHVVFTAVDADHAATLSPAMISLIRGEIGFEGLLMTDDLSMQALTGSLGERASSSLLAGCDVVLHCNGVMDEMEPVAANTPRLEGRAAERADAALALRKSPDAFDVAAARVRVREMTGLEHA
ncbi:MAG: beta-N-acetylhexosaminidase [Pseudomonadota bacterium]